MDLINSIGRAEARASVGAISKIVVPSLGNRNISGDMPSSQRGGQDNFLVPENDRLNTLKKQFDDKTLKRMGVIECSTCANRVYQDKSDDSGVSFQSPTHLEPSQAASKVSAHEQEHVVREQAKAEEEGREVVSQNVKIYRSVCPECGKSYVSGGLTTTTTMSASDSYEAASSKNMEGNLMDIRI